MNIQSFGGRMVVFLVAAAAILVTAAGLTWADTRDDLARGDRESIAAASDNDDNPDVSRSIGLDADDRPLTATEKAKVTAAAANAVGSGTVTDLEASDDFGTAYEAEVLDRAGAEWDVELDAKFAVVSKSRDS